MGHTGTVMVLTTPDAQRSFLSFFVSEDMHLPEPVASAIRNSKIVAIEGECCFLSGKAPDSPRAQAGVVLATAAATVARARALWSLWLSRHNHVVCVRAPD